MSIRKASSEQPKRRPIANRNPAPPTATITPEPGEPFDAAENLKPRTPGNPKTQEPNTPSKYIQHPGMPVRTSHKHVAITPRSAYVEHDPIPTPHTLLNPMSDVPNIGSAISKVTRTINDEIHVAGPNDGRQTCPNYRHRNIPVPYSSRTEPIYRNRDRKLDTGWSNAKVNGSIVEPRYVDKRGADPSNFETYLWLNRHNRLSDWKDAVAERDRYYIETPWHDRRYPGQEPQLSDTDIWAYRNFGGNRDWLDTPYYDGRYYQFDRRYLDYDVGPETRYGLKRHYKSYQSDPGAVNTSLWLRRHYETAPDYTDYNMWKAGQRAKRRTLAKIQKERQRQLARRHGNVFRAPSPYDEHDDLDTVIQPRVKVLPHDKYREPKKPLSMMTMDGSAVARPRRKISKEEWEIELLKQKHKREAKVYRYRHNVQKFREKELVPEWIDAIETPPFRDFRHKSKLVPDYEYDRQQLLDDERKFSRESDISSVPRPAQKPRVPSGVGEYNTYVGNYDTFNKFDHYYNRRKDGAPLNKYGNNYKSRNMADWYWN